MKKFLPILVVAAVIGFGGGLLAGGADSSVLVGNLDLDQLIKDLVLVSLALLVSFFLQIIIHELGHLVMGLFSGYRFVSFRIMNLLIAKNDQGKLQVTQYAVAGTGGQCLMAPPAYREVGFPYRRYLWGGVLANAVASFLVWLMLGSSSLFGLTFVFVGILMVVTNGLPMQYNDARTIQLAGQSSNNQRILYNGLAINQLSAKGVTYTEMPDELFALVPPVPRYTYLNTQQELMRVNRLMDEGRLEAAWDLLEDLWSKKEQIAFPHYQGAIAGELMGLLCLLAPTDPRIATLWQTPQLQQLLQQPLMGTFRLKALHAKVVEKDDIKAIQLLQEGLTKKDKMPTFGEAKLEEKLLRHLLTRWQASGELVTPGDSE